MTDRSVKGGGAPWPSWPIITMERSMHSVGGHMLSLIGTTAAASGGSSFTANDLLAFPFVLSSPTPIYKAFVYNGSSPGGNFSIGIYDADYNLLAQTASTAGSGASTAQAVTLACKLSIGSYYCAMAADNATINRYFRWSATNGREYIKTFGCWRQASVTLATLPNPATPAAYQTSSFPYFGLIARSTFDL